MRFFLVLCFAFSLRAAAFDHAPWQRVLARAVNQVGEVDYASLRQDRELAAYVAALRDASPENRRELFASKAEELAYWINAYNALVTWGVAKAYPTRSVRDLGVLFGFFRRKEYVLGGRTMSLQQLENDVIRARHREPRIHFAIVCASLSCPKLSRQAYTGANLEEQLAFQTSQYFAETRNLAVTGNTVTLAKILDWYGGDFGNALDYARRHTSEDRRRQLDALKNPRVLYREYDWAINDPGSRGRAKTAEERELARPGS